MKYIFWDFNGTILDDAKLCFDILNEMLIEEEMPTVTFDEYLMIFTFPIEDYYRKVFDLNRTSFKDLAHRFIERYQPRSLDVKLHQGIIHTIQVCISKGIKNVLLSASQLENLKEQLKHYQIEDLFEHVLGTKDVYANSKVMVANDFITTNKIDPKDVLMIGDTLHDYEVAEELGFRIILYTKGHQHQKRFGDIEKINEIQEILGKI